MMLSSVSTICFQPSSSVAAQAEAARRQKFPHPQDDVTHISPAKMLETINALIKSGKMSVDESSSLIALLPDTETAQAMGQPLGADVWHTPVNFMEKLDQMIDYSRYSHNEAGVTYGLKAREALKRVQGQKASVDLAV